MVGWTMFGIVIFLNICIYVMIQLYFEGHEAFTDDHKVFDKAKIKCWNDNSLRYAKVEMKSTINVIIKTYCNLVQDARTFFGE